ncbi:MAG: FkbM family methyltransferase [Methylocystis sp.]|uniref:FkbM family methyltransferase n=1 Tax=Methylocystis sp. TaxID=1911079 RepID=UPI003DA25446
MPLPHMISHAQNGEDVVLRRALHSKTSGLWVDIGACHPEIDSVTNHFSLLGWHGVNVEPDAGLHTLLSVARPRDANVRCAIAADSRGRRFYPTGTRGHGTLSAALAEARTPKDSYCVETMTLSALIDTYASGREIDFCKIDVEGHEAEVIASGDWRRHRPRIVIVEAVDLHGNRTHQTWEEAILSKGYLYSLFDGLNRWYVREEEPELREKIEFPASVFDNWTHVSHINLLHEQDNLIKALDLARNELESARLQLEELSRYEDMTLLGFLRQRLFKTKETPVI